MSLVMAPKANTLSFLRRKAGLSQEALATAAEISKPGSHNWNKARREESKRGIKSHLPVPWA